MTDLPYAELGEELMTAAASRVPIAPLTSRYPELTLEDAYRVQEHQVRAWDRAGRHLIGFKVGLTSKAMQRMLGVASPDFGHLYQDMVLDNTAPINAERFIAPRVEPEVTFVLKDDLSGPGLTIIDAVRAVDYAIASIELIDSRIADWRIGLADTIADNASSGALLLGKVPVALDAVDLGLLGCVVTKNGEVVASGAGAAVLGHPINGLLWLANQLGRFGRTLPAGSVVMSGSITAAVPVAPGDRVTAAFAGLGTVDARVAPASHDSEENS